MVRPEMHKDEIYVAMFAMYHLAGVYLVQVANVPINRNVYNI